ncbi:MAG: hypothetical protein QM651_15960 [Rhodoblastus sp.]
MDRGVLKTTQAGMDMLKRFMRDERIVAPHPWGATKVVVLAQADFDALAAGIAAQRQHEAKASCDSEASFPVPPEGRDG